MFAPGDLVQIINPNNPYFGSVGTVKAVCKCFEAILIQVFNGVTMYSVSGMAECFAESSLKKIGGERPAVDVETDEEVAA